MDIAIKKEENLVEAVVKTIAFFNMFQYPLSAFEVWRYLNIKSDYNEVLVVLNHLHDNKLIDCSQGLYFLNRNEKNLICRRQRYKHTERKIKRVKKILYIFRFIPWIKMVAVGNMIGSDNLKDGSDIDLFIICQNNRIWISRFFCSSIIKLLNIRPRPGREKDTICLSFYIGERNLNLVKYKLEPEDRYFDYWLVGLSVIYDQGNYYNNLMEANPWVFKQFPNWQISKNSRKRRVTALESKFYYDFIDLILGGLEKQFKNLQLRILPDIYKKIMNKDSRVVINDNIIKLHVNDRRGKFQEKYLEQVNEYKI